MKKSILISAAVLAFVLMGCEKTESSKPIDIQDENTKFSYALGLEIGGSLKRLNTDINMDAFVKGINDTMSGGITLITAAEALEIKKSTFEKMQAEQAEKASKDAAAYLDKNKAKEGVTTTESGLQYEVLKQGDGPKPTEKDRVKVHYVGTLTDGTEFDSSIKRGTPAEFAVTGVIKGWTEALLLMNTGTKLKVTIPSELGYGTRGAGAKIPPNSTLIFEMELLEVIAGK